MAKLIRIAPIIILVSLTIVCLIYVFVPPVPKAKWDPSPDVEIITVAHAGEVDLNYIPDVQVWGNGHIIWVEHIPDGSRRVFEGYLTEAEMTNLIDRLIQAGFFDQYKRFDLRDVEWGDYLRVNLTNIAHQVTFQHYTDYANQQVLDLIAGLRSGVNLAEIEFVPKNGYLYAYPIEELKQYRNETNADYHWPDDKFGTISELASQDEVQLIDEELDFAWEIVNSPMSLVKSQDEIYWIALIIPKVSR